MSGGSHAVFLSYASQDADAVRRLCEALRAAGVEVWFDQSELVGGDAWDQKIRRQIAECALFVPVISGHTQARREGYFRVEWRLAAQRTHAMADGTPFLVPVVIDDTGDAEALVPAEFKDVQWTRLRDAEALPGFALRVKRLLAAPDVAALSAAAAPVTRSATAAGRKKRRPSRTPALALAVAIAVLGLALWRTRRPAATSKPDVAPAARAPVAAIVPELKRAADLVRSESATSEDYALADEIVARFLPEHPSDPQANILAAEISNGMYLRGFDRSEERYARAGQLAERAYKLAPDDPYALNALGLWLGFRSADLQRAESLLRQAIALQPAEPAFYRNLTYYVLAKTNPAQALTLAQAAIDRFPKSGLAAYNLALLERDTGDLGSLETALDRAIDNSQLASAILMKAWVVAMAHGDMAASKQWLDRLPAADQLNERAVILRFAWAYLTHEPAAGLRALHALPSTWLRDWWFYAGPKDLLIGELLEEDGKPELARESYLSALAEIGRQKKANPADSVVRQAEMWTLLRLGQVEEARRLARLWADELPHPYQIGFGSWIFTPVSALLQVGERARALAVLHEITASKSAWARQPFRVVFDRDPHLAAFRNDPEIVALLADPNPDRRTR